MRCRSILLEPTSLLTCSIKSIPELHKHCHIALFIHCQSFLIVILKSEWSNFSSIGNSPDLSPSDFFLWEYLKDRVYKIKPQYIPERKAIIDPIEQSEIPVKVCHDVKTNFCKRINCCITRMGEHLEHVL